MKGTKASDLPELGTVSAAATSNHGKPLLFERDFGNGYKLFTFVYWAE